MRSTTLISLGTFLAMFALATPALAQKKGDAKKTEPAPKKEEPDENAGAWSENDKKADNAAEVAPKKEPSTVEPPAEKWDITDVEEVPGRSYFFVGLRYRGNVVPGFMLNMFVDEGKTVWTNMIGAEFDLRKDGFSLVPALTYHELGTGDILFKQKNTKDIAGNYSLVNSGMKVVYASVDLLWSTKLAKNVEFEYGAGFGLGAVFGDLENSWVQEDPNGQLRAEATGKQYSRCNAVLPAGTGCNKADHQNSEVDKVNGYKEPSWFGGGSKPALFPWISVPQIGLRFKPIKQFVARLGIGFSLTGFWFGLSGQYGLEKRRD
jgi:hypothetical protein